MAPFTASSHLGVTPAEAFRAAVEYLFSKPHASDEHEQQVWRARELGPPFGEALLDSLGSPFGSLPSCSLPVEGSSSSGVPRPAAGAAPGTGPPNAGSPEGGCRGRWWGPLGGGLFGAGLGLGATRELHQRGGKAQLVATVRFVYSAGADAYFAKFIGGVAGSA